MRKKTSVEKAKRVQIFKWLLKKHRCSVSLEKSFANTNGKKTWFFTVHLHGKDAEEHVLCVDKNVKLDADAAKTFGIQTFAESIYVRCKDIVSYVDVLDAILDAMSRNNSACWMVSKSFHAPRKMFLKKGTTLEELAVEFDMEWRDVFRCYKKEDAQV